MPSIFKNGRPLSRTSDSAKWHHSDFREVAYTFIFGAHANREQREFEIVMKSLICLVLGFGTFGCGKAQNSPVQLPEWKAAVHVTDELRQPVNGAHVVIGYYISPPPGQSIAMDKKVGLTDLNGLFRASARAQSVDLEFAVQKDGYYPTYQSYELGLNYDPVRWNPTQSVVLKKVGTPVPMYARKAQIEVPEIGKPIGFDLLEYGWVAPYGKGKHGDFIFETQRRWKDRNDFETKMEVKFFHTSDGISGPQAPTSQGSALRLPATAPLEGYLSELSRTLSRDPVSGWVKDGNKDQNYYFRVRTELDETGSVKSALYGKIHGDFQLDPINSKTLYIFFTYYINPETNSRNVEFDPSKNLFGDVPPLQQVKAP
jgi:hypothetical protein